MSEERDLPPLNREVHVNAMIDHFRGNQGSIVLLTKSIYLGPVSLNTLDSVINVDQGTQGKGNASSEVRKSGFNESWG